MACSIRCPDRQALDLTMVAVLLECSYVQRSGFSLARGQPNLYCGWPCWSSKPISWLALLVSQTYIVAGPAGQPNLYCGWPCWTAKPILLLALLVSHNFIQVLFCTLSVDFIKDKCQLTA